MRNWLKAEILVPRWFVLILTILSVLTFSITETIAHELHQETIWLKSEVTELTCGRGDIARLCSVDPLNLPPLGTLVGFIEISVASICLLVILLCSGWILVRRNVGRSADHCLAAAQRDGDDAR